MKSADHQILLRLRRAQWQAIVCLVHLYALKVTLS